MVVSGASRVFHVLNQADQDGLPDNDGVSKIDLMHVLALNQVQNRLSGSPCLGSTLATKLLRHVFLTLGLCINEETT